MLRRYTYMIIPSFPNREIFLRTLGEIIGTNYLDAQDNEFVKFVHRRIVEFKLITYRPSRTRDIIKLLVD